METTCTQEKKGNLDRSRAESIELLRRNDRVEMKVQGLSLAVLDKGIVCSGDLKLSGLGAMIMTKPLVVGKNLSVQANTLFQLAPVIASGSISIQFSGHVVLGDMMVAHTQISSSVSVTGGGKVVRSDSSSKGCQIVRNLLAQMISGKKITVYQHEFLINTFLPLLRCKETQGAQFEKSWDSIQTLNNIALLRIPSQRVRGLNLIGLMKRVSITPKFAYLDLAVLRDFQS